MHLKKNAIVQMQGQNDSFTELVGNQIAAQINIDRRMDRQTDMQTNTTNGQADRLWLAHRWIAARCTSTFGPSLPNIAFTGLYASGTVILCKSGAYAHSDQLESVGLGILMLSIDTLCSHIPLSGVLLSAM